MNWVRLITNPMVLWVLAFLVALHQYLNWGSWFELKDIHHEVFIVALVFGGIMLYLVRGGR